MYSSVDKIVLVTGNLNAHRVGLLYLAFCAEEAYWLVNWFGWYFMSVYGGWLDVAGGEVGVVCW